MSEFVRITEVAPRDGLQNEPGIIPTDDKALLIELLSRTGVDEIEVTSFVSPKWVPQLGDAAELCEIISGVKPAETLFSALVPNEKGMRAVLVVNEHAGFRLIDKVAVFTAASETFSQRNTNASIGETIERFKPVVKLAAENDLAVRGYVSCAFACPFEGSVPSRSVARVVSDLVELGVNEIDLGDTIGAARPDTTGALVEAVRAALPDGRGTPLTLHLHDTFGAAAACVRAALSAGVRSFDGAAAGLGGCPYAETDSARAPGNIDTRALVAVVHDAGYETGVDQDKLADAAAFAETIVQRARAAGQGEPA